jgi:hypothetical protein
MAGDARYPVKVADLRPGGSHLGAESNPWHGRGRMSPGSTQASRRLGPFRLRITTRVYVPMKPGRVTRMVIATPPGR